MADQEESREDISPRTLAVLVLLVLVVSFVGAWVSINSMQTGMADQPRTEGGAVAQVSFKIVDPNEGVAGATGHVSLNIEKPQ